MAAFDGLAPTYDDNFTHTQIGQYLRGRVHQRLLSHFRAGDYVLELGCGTGEDALFLAEHGIRITATDASEEMLAITRKKTQHRPNVAVSPLDLQNLPETRDHFDGVFSNFGVLNCLDDWQPLAQWLVNRIKPGGIVGLGMMSPYCAWEFLWHSLHLDFDVALRRLGGSLFKNITITYPTVKHITQDFAPQFQRIHLMPLGLFLPPSDAFGVIEKRPRLLKALIRLENRSGYIPQIAMFADHYWIEFERT